jgi:peptide/nickel transport system permease protein
MTLLRFLAVRLIGMAGVLLVIACLTYAVFYLLPGNPAQLSCGRPCTPENLARAETFMGTDLSWYRQLGDFLTGIVAGRDFGSGGAVIHCPAPCFGYSFQQSAPVTELLVTRLPLTLSIAIGAAVLWMILGVGGGVIAGLRPGRVADRLVMTVSIAGVSAPVYLVGLLAILVFGFTLHWFPTGGYVPITEDPVAWVSHLVLPWCTLAITTAAIYARLTRSQMIETLDEDFVRTARAKGLHERRVVLRHGVRNALIPVVTIFGLDLGALLGGTVIVEKVFSVQGLGALLIGGVATRDLQLVVGLTLFAALVIVVMNVVIDLVNGFIDPRVKAVV